ncbi:MAG: glucose 1-dehydrogenase [Alphaproteobacteria bacterium]|nr:glucose 1-dehydrogenase [Alphaproteobacteria bacterium]
MAGRLQGRVALVTGAASGFGAGIARRFAGEGASVVVADIDDDAGREVIEEIAAAGGAASYRHADVGIAGDVKDMVAHAQAAFGGLDILVNNAGWAYSNRPSTEVPEADFDRLFATNVKSVYLATREAVPLLRRQGGVMLNVASTAAARPRPNLTWYNATKGALVTITRSLALELAPDRIRVCAINPVIGETGLTSTFMGVPDTPENRAPFLATIPLGRFSTPADIANAALFLASDEAAFLTGVCLDVDGGRSV